jgi:hypothetical protein
MDKYINIIDKIIQNDSHFANSRNSYKKSGRPPAFLDDGFLVS